MAGVCINVYHIHTYIHITQHLQDTNPNVGWRENRANERRRNLWYKFQENLESASENTFTTTTTATTTTMNHFQSILAGHFSRLHYSDFVSAAEMLFLFLYLSLCVCVCPSLSCNPTDILFNTLSLPNGMHFPDSMNASHRRLNTQPFLLLKLDAQTKKNESQFVFCCFCWCWCWCWRCCCFYPFNFTLIAVFYLGFQAHFAV